MAEQRERFFIVNAITNLAQWIQGIYKVMFELAEDVTYAVGKSPFNLKKMDAEKNGSKPLLSNLSLLDISAPHIDKQEPIALIFHV